MQSYNSVYTFKHIYQHLLTSKDPCVRYIAETNFKAVEGRQRKKIKTSCMCKERSM